MTVAPAPTVVLPLDPDHVVALDRLRTRLGLGANVDPLRGTSHISLAVLLGAPPLDVVDAVIERLAATTAPVSTSARGLGVFTARNGSVLHVPVVRTAALDALHLRLVAALDEAGIEVEGQHRPETWLPHITVVHPPLEPRAMGDLMAVAAAGPPVGWHLRLDHLARLDAAGGLFALRLVGT